MSFSDDTWNSERFADFKQFRDENPRTASFETVLPLYQKQLKGLPLTHAERTYLRRFLGANVCQQFFCRLGLAFREIPGCWTKGTPTDEQCSRCELNYMTGGQPGDFRDPEVNPGPAPDGESVGLYAQPDHAGVVRFEWKALRAPDTFPGLAGQSLPGVQVHIKSPLTAVYPVCLPSLSKSFKGGCDKQCETCPAFGHYDPTAQAVITGKASVLVDVDKLKPTTREGLEVLVAMADEARAAHGEHVKENPDAGETDQANPGS